MSIISLTTRKSISKALSKKVQTIIEYVVETVKPLEVYMIGSMMRGSVHANSDLDLVVVVKDPLNRQEISLDVLPNRPHKDVPLDLHLVGQKEFLEFKDIGGICFEGAKHGKLVFQREVP